MNRMENKSNYEVLIDPQYKQSSFYVVWVCKLGNAFSYSQK